MSLPADVLSFVKSHPAAIVDSLPNADLAVAADACVLSVYVDNSESQPGKRQQWREWLRAQFRSERHRLSAASPEKMLAFERCVIALESRLPDLHAEVKAENANVAGWMLLCPESGDVIEERLASPPQWLCRAGSTAVLMPYLAASLPSHTVVVLIDRERATIARIQRGMVQLVDVVEADDTGDAHDVLLASAGRRLAIIAANDACVVLGGAVPSVAQFAAHLHEDLAKRSVVADGLQVHTPFALIPLVAYRALDQLETDRQLALIDGFATRAHLTRRAAFSMDSVATAVQAGAVERMVVSMALWSRQPDAVDAVIQQAIRAGALVEAATPRCAAVLDAQGGIAADLRFSVRSVETLAPA